MVIEKHAEKCCAGKTKANGTTGCENMECVCGCTCDGYHTFDELYEHRIILFLALCTLWYNNCPDDIWMSKKHSDGSELPGWFILGINKEPGFQMTYHLPDRYWDEASYVANILAIAPEWDGHTSDAVLERLRNL